MAWGRLNPAVARVQQRPGIQGQNVRRGIAHTNRTGERQWVRRKCRALVVTEVEPGEKSGLRAVGPS